MKLQVLKNQTGARRLVDAWEASCSGAAGMHFDVPSYCVIASWYAGNNGYPQALQVLDCALLQFPSSLDVFFLKIALLLEKPAENTQPDLLSTLQNAQLVADELLQPALFRMEAYCSRGQYAQAGALLQSVQKPLPPLPQREQWAQRLQELGGQILHLYAAARKEPFNAEHFHKLWLSIELSGNYKEGRTLHLALIEQFPYCYHAWHNLGLIYQHNKQWKKALEAFEYAYICNPYFEEAYLEFGALSFERGLFQQALCCYAEMAAHMEIDSKVLVRMGNCYREMQQLQKARECFHNALQLDPLHADACYNLGICYAREQHHFKAIQWLLDAVRRMPENEGYHLALANAYAKAGSVEKAARHYWKAVEIAPEDAGGWLALACFLFQNDETSNAHDALEIALENTCSAELKYAMSACLFRMGQREQAMQLLKKTYSKNSAPYALLFEWLPSLRNDLEVMQIFVKK